MSNQNYIIEMLELKDNNIKFYNNFYYKEKIKNVVHKIFEVYLSYKPLCCNKCGVLFDDKFEKHGFIVSNIKIPDVSGFKTISVNIFSSTSTSCILFQPYGNFIHYL